MNSTSSPEPEPDSSLGPAQEPDPIDAANTIILGPPPNLPTGLFLSLVTAANASEPHRFQNTFDVASLPEFEGIASGAFSIGLFNAGVGCLILPDALESLTLREAPIGLTSLQLDGDDVHFKIHPVGDGTQTFVLEGMLTAAWIANAPEACDFLNGSEENAAFEITLTLTVTEVFRVELNFPERCAGEIEKIYFTDDSLAGLTVNLFDDDGTQFYPRNLDFLQPVPMKLSANEEIRVVEEEIESPAPDRVISLNNIRMPAQVTTVTVSAPAMIPVELSVISPADVETAEIYFVFPGFAAPNLEIVEDSYGENGWGRVSNGIIPQLRSIEIASDTTPCTVRAKKMELRSLTPDVCSIVDWDVDITTAGIFDTQEVLWWARLGTYAQLVNDGRCQLQLATVDTAPPGTNFEFALDVTLANVDQMQ